MVSLLNAEMLSRRVGAALEVSEASTVDSRYIAVQRIRGAGIT